MNNDSHLLHIEELMTDFNLFADWLREELNPKIARKT
jgi:hypothetical protein